VLSDVGCCKEAVIYLVTWENYILLLWVVKRDWIFTEKSK